MPKPNADFYILNTETQTLTFSNTFNGSLNPYHSVITKAKKIVFGSNYNRKIKIPSHIIAITFGNNYSQPLSLTSELQSLTLGNAYNKPLYLKSGTKLNTLNLGVDYNQPLVLSPSITKLLLNIAFNQPLELTHNITHLAIHGHNLMHQLVLTPNIMFLEMHSYYVHMFNKRLIHIQYSCVPDNTLPILNKSLISFYVRLFKRNYINFNKCIRNFDTLDNVHRTIIFNIPKAMTSLKIFMYTGDATIGKNITHLCLNTYRHINLPKHLKHLTYSCQIINYSMDHILLPVNVKQIVFNNILRWSSNTLICSFEHVVERLELFMEYAKDPKRVMDNLSDGIEHLIIKNYCRNHKLLQNLPALKKISMGYSQHSIGSTQFF